MWGIYEVKELSPVHLSIYNCLCSFSILKKKGSVWVAKTSPSHLFCPCLWRSWSTDATPVILLLFSYHLLPKVLLLLSEVTGHHTSNILIYIKRRHSCVPRIPMEAPRRPHAINRKGRVGTGEAHQGAAATAVPRRNLGTFHQAHRAARVRAGSSSGPHAAWRHLGSHDEPFSLCCEQCLHMKHEI